MPTHGFDASKASSICLKVSLLVILLSTGFLYITAMGSQTDGISSFVARSSNEKSLETLGNRSVAYVQTNELYADFLPAGGSKTYTVVAPEHCLVSFFFQTGNEKATLDVEAEGAVNRTRLDIVWLPAPHFYFTRNKSQVRFLVGNPQAEIVSYRFYVDISEPLRDSQSKSIPLKGGKATFEVDLKKDDRMLLELGSQNRSEFRIWVLVLYYEILPEIAYKLRIYRQSLCQTLYFNADLGGRYYVVVDSVEGEGEFHLTSSTFSPAWNQEWFWPAVLFAFLITEISLINTKRIVELERPASLSLASCSSWFATIGLFFSVVGSFSYGTLISVPLFYMLIVSYGLSHVLQIYATYLDRKIPSGNCSSCGRIVNLQEVNYCCGKIVKDVSDAWFLLPLSSGSLFFTISYVVLREISPPLLSYSLWIGSCGNIVGGATAWWVNRNVYPIKSWKQNPKRYYIPGHIRFVSVGLLITGILCAFLSPLLVGTSLEVFLTQHTESFLPAHAPWMRIRIAPLTVSVYVVLGSAILAVFFGVLLAYQMRKILTRNTSKKQD